MPPKKKSTEPGSIEDALSRLEEIAAKLQSDDIPLEASLALYEEGLQLTRTCAERLRQAALTVKRLEKDFEGTSSLLEEEPGEEND